MSLVLQVRDVKKRFGQVQAVDGVSFDIRRGEIFALLGPNGAGKTTLVRMLMGLQSPDAGSVEYRLSGPEPRPPRPPELGYLPEERGLYKDLPVLRNLEYFGALRGMDAAAARREAEAWLERLDLRDRAAERLDSLSKGNQQKVQFASAILHRPAFAALDEPFSGLDPVNQERFLALLHELRRDGMTILLSAHQMSLVERLADRMLLVNRGREVLSGTLAEIRSGNAGSSLRLRLAEPAAPETLRLPPGVLRAERTAETELRLFLEEGADLSGLLVAVGSQLRIREVLSERLDLHDLYVQAVGRDAKAEPAQEVSA